MRKDCPSKWNRRILDIRLWLQGRPGGAAEGGGVPHDDRRHGETWSPSSLEESSGRNYDQVRSILTSRLSRNCRADWKLLLEDYVAGVDYPVSLFYKEILAVYPNVKVLLTERDPVKWYESVKGSILRVNTIQISWPQSFLSRVLGLYHQNRLPYEISCYSKDGLAPGKTVLKYSIKAWTLAGLYEAVLGGKESAVKFYEDHVREVKRTVPPQQLLVFQVKEGWAPLCEFLNLPQPDTPFPRVNDTSTMLLVGRWSSSFSF